MNLKNMRIHKAKQHKIGSSPIPQLDGAGSDFAAYEFTFEAHENCTDDDIVEALKTNFHCPLDDNKIEKNDPIRHFDVKKTKDIFKENKVFEVFAKENKTVDDRAFMNSTHWDITIRIKEFQRLF